MAEFEQLSEVFNFNGHYLRQEYCSNGHINDTSRVVYKEGKTEVSYVHQKINHHVFMDIPAVMENIVHVTEHQQKKLRDSGCKDIERRALSLIPTRDGRTFHKDDAGNYWRTFRFIDGARGHETADNNDQLFQAARAFGLFQQQLSDLPHQLHETIVDFHDTPKRFSTFLKVLERDPMNRAADAKDAIKYTLSRECILGRIIAMLESGEIPQRVTHNDTKLNNVLIDDQTGEGICIVDLDTVMSGSVLYDFGDLVRAASCNVAEDAPDIHNVNIDLDAFTAILKGYWDYASGFLTDAEKQLLPFSSQLISLELGMRFLTDFLEGDHYFKTQRPEQNLDRCNRQYTMARSIESNLSQMERLVSRI